MPALATDQELPPHVALQVLELHVTADGDVPTARPYAASVLSR
ncbi:hypothetical protein [Streptomyces sp. CB02959]|nr:hypothetical protein [Streptomyces sp. CB02959]